MRVREFIIVDITDRPECGRPSGGGPAVRRGVDRNSPRGRTPSNVFVSNVTAMTAIALTPTQNSARTSWIGAGVLAFGCAVLAYMDFFVTTSDGKFVSVADYVYLFNMYPLLIGLFLLVLGLRGVQAGRDGKLGTVGFVVLCIGLAGLAVTGIDSAITQDAQALGPVYVLSTFASFLGLVILAVGAIHARKLPWWTAPALTIAWIIGGTVGDGGPLGFKASAVVLAVVGLACAATASKAADK
jgi:hypothetical protein